MRHHGVAQGVDGGGVLAEGGEEDRETDGGKDGVQYDAEQQREIAEEDAALGQYEAPAPARPAWAAWPAP